MTRTCQHCQAPSTRKAAVSPIYVPDYTKTEPFSPQNATRILACRDCSRYQLTHGVLPGQDHAIAQQGGV